MQEIDSLCKTKSINLKKLLNHNLHKINLFKIQNNSNTNHHKILINKLNYLVSLHHKLVKQLKVVKEV